jgi:hypothetical protein
MRNPTTGIDFDTDRFIVTDTDGTVIQQGVRWPRADGEAIQGGTPYRWYLMTFGDAPASDPTHYAAQDPNWTYTDYADPQVGLPTGTATKAWQLVPRPAEEQKNIVQAVYKQVVNAIVPAQTEPETRTRTMAAILAQSQGQSLSTDQQALLDQLAADELAVSQSETRRDQLLASIDANSSYDIFFGWPLDRATVETLAGGF